MSNIKFLVVVNNAAHDGHVTRVNLDECWSAHNENGWTDQDITGAHGSILSEHDSRSEADTALAEWLECDSVETGRYCYTHNPYV